MTPSPRLQLVVFKRGIKSVISSYSEVLHCYQIIFIGAQAAYYPALNLPIYISGYGSITQQKPH